MNRFTPVIEKQKWVPEIQLGGDASSGGASAMMLIEQMGVKAGKDLALDMNIKK